MKTLEEITIEKLIKLEESIQEDKTHKLEEMSEIGRQNQFIIKVFGREGYIPHFHIYMLDGRKACLQFKENAYFPHNQYTNTLTNTELKEIMNFLNDKNDKIDTITNWQMCVIVWNMNNVDSKKQLDKDLIMPNYHSPKYEKWGVN